MTATNSVVFQGVCSDYLGKKVNKYLDTELIGKNVIIFDSQKSLEHISQWCQQHCRAKWFIIPSPYRLPHSVLFECSKEASLFKLIFLD